MLQPRPAASSWAAIGAFLVAAGASSAADPPKLRELRLQQVGTATYFHAAFEAPANLSVSPLQTWWAWRDPEMRDGGRQARLVPQDEQSRAVYARLEMPQDAQERPANEPQPRQPVPVVGLEFVGKCSGKGKAKFLLLYPTEEQVRLAEDKEKKLPARTVRRRDWVEVALELDFDKAVNVPAAADVQKRKAAQPPSRADLEGLWASAQATRFAVLESLAPEFSFYGYAREATRRKYGVPAPSLRGSIALGGDGLTEQRRLYETTTGAAAIAESLQLQRMLGTGFRDTGARKIDIKKVAGIDIAEHPWKKMMGDQKPAVEPLARLVPHDNYYLYFKNIRKFIDLGELFDQWGTSLVRAYEINSRDYQLKQRYERQLCLRSTVLGKTLGPLVIRGLAVTGSDAYLREGSDVALIFQVVNQDLFLGAVNAFVAEARQEWGAQLKEGKEDYHKVTIESFLTPLREVSLYRASLGDYVVYANSPAGIRRVIDTQQGRSRALADSLDFQYMRSVFRLEDQQEDGFAFLSDPFIRNLVGPASKIKEKRRLEALTSLHMTTNDALFTAWETGKLPAAPKNLYVSAILKPEEIYVPDGKGVTWDPRRQLAASDVYNTLQFATPLIELPIDLVTESEERDYLQFRAEYLGLWRGYFDPIGMRFALNDQQVRIDTYILPLIQNSQYNELRRRTGGGTTPLDVKAFAPSTVFQMVSHIAADAPERGVLGEGLRALGVLGKNKGLDWLGDWFMVRIDDSPIYGKLAELEMRQQLDPDAPHDRNEEIRLAFQMPVTLGVSVKNPLVFAGVLTALRGAVNNAAPDAVTWEPLQPPYKEVSIVRIQAKPDGMVARAVNAEREKDPFLPALYYAQVDGGFYLSLREDCIKEIIDRSAARKQGKLPKPETVPINSSLYVAPGAAKTTMSFISYYLEQQSRRQALANGSLWYALHRAGAIPADASEEVRQKTALHLLGFVPVSADGAAYDYEARTDEVVNRRHGSLRKPQKHPSLAAQAPLAQVLERLQTVRADLRFREDGVHTVVTIERTGK